MVNGNRRDTICRRAAINSMDHRKRYAHMSDTRNNFRAWDGKQMLFRSLCDRNWYNDEDKLVCEALPEDAHNWKIMQSTGILDKNGEVIYVGDIVSFTHCELLNHPKAKARVTWNQGGCSYQLMTSETSFTGFFDQPMRKYEVIGNIYANHELVEVTT